MLELLLLLSFFGLPVSRPRRITGATGLAHVPALPLRIQADETLPPLARELFALHAAEYEQVQAKIAAVEGKLMAWHRADERSRRLAQIPGVGPIGARLLTMKTPAPEAFRSGRLFAAWIGLAPKDHSTAGKVLRSVLVVGATALIRRCARGTLP